MSEPVYKSHGVLKVSDELGIVFGYAIVCAENGEPYYDLQGDHISESEMLKAATDFMENARVAKEMHSGDQIGDVVFAYPLTSDMADGLEMAVTKTGLLIGLKPSDETVLAKVKDGTYRGFSIGGSGEREEVAGG